MKVHKVTSIDNRLRMKRQTKCWKVLRYLNAQRRVIDTEPAGEWINREHRCFARETKNGTHVCAVTEPRA